MAERVQPRPVALVGGVLVALVVGAWFAVRPVPDAVVGLFGGATGLERTGGVRVRYRSAAGEVRTLELPGIGADMVPDVSDTLVGGGLEMREALEGPWVREVTGQLPAGVTVEGDYWRDESGGQYHTAYLQAKTRAELERAVAGVPFAADIGYERVDSEEGTTYWRTYLLARERVIDGAGIANATRSYDPNTNRPIVLLDLTRAATERFCDETARLVGHKLAIVLGGRVRSAPIIMGRICGGRASIAMGTGNPQHQEREADMLRSVLMQGALAPGGAIEAASVVPAADVRAQEWAGRGMLGLVAGLAFAGLVWLVLRFARPTWRALAPADAAGSVPTRRLLVTLLAPVALFLGGKILLPGINSDELDHLIELGGGWRNDAGVLQLGIMPLLTAFVLVELVALAIPGSRHDPRRRVRLGQAVAVVGTIIALVQAYFIALYFEDLSRAGAEIVDEPGMKFRIIAMVTLATGTLLLAVLAGMVTAHGLGNGYGVILVSSLALGFWRTMSLDRATVLAVLAVVTIALATAAVLRMRIGGDAREAELRVPSSGMVPLSDAGGLALAVFAIVRLGLEAPLADVTSWLLDLQGRRWLMFGLVVVFVPIWSWLFARPAVVERIALQGGIPRPTTAMWLRATLLSLVLVAGAALLDLLAPRSSAVFAMLAAAVLLDIADDARAHRRRLAPAAVLHQIQRAGVIERVLGDAGIVCHIHASNLRTLFAFFGPWAPAVVLVREADAARARTLVADATAPAKATLPVAELRD